MKRSSALTLSVKGALQFIENKCWKARVKLLGTSVFVPLIFLRPSFTISFPKSNPSATENISEGSLMIVMDDGSS